MQLWKTLATAALTAVQLAVAGAGPNEPFHWERLDKNDSVLLIVDLQVGLYSLARDWDATQYREQMLAHGALGKLFDLPVIMTSSAETGPNGPLFQEFIDWYPEAPIIRRQGEVNAWDNEEFRNTVRSFNKSQIIMGGIVTDVCTAFLAYSLREEGYSVWANLEASGTTSPLIRDAANSAMARAGVNVVSLFSILCDLMRDWRNIPGAAEVLPFIDRYFPVYGLVARAHGAATKHGDLLPGEEEILGPQSGGILEG